jgi:hypothetical protein
MFFEEYINFKIVHYLSHCGAELYLLKVSEVKYAPSSTD